MLETVMDKQRIFEIYLNSVEWGNGVTVHRQRRATTIAFRPTNSRRGRRRGLQ